MKTLLELLKDENFIENVCYSYRHDFGLLSEEDKKSIRNEFKNWKNAIINNYKYYSEKDKNMVFGDLNREIQNYIKNNDPILTSDSLHISEYVFEYKNRLVKVLLPISMDLNNLDDDTDVQISIKK